MHIARDQANNKTFTYFEFNFGEDQKVLLHKFTAVTQMQETLHICTLKLTNKLVKRWSKSEENLNFH